MVSCTYFTTHYFHINTTLEKENTQDSFLIYICVDGEAEISANSVSERIAKGETILLPAAIKSYQIKAENAKLLEVYV